MTAMTRLPSGPFAIGGDLTVPLARTVDALTAGIPIGNVNRVGRVEREIDLAALEQCRAIFDAASALRTACRAAGIDQARASVGVHDTRMTRVASPLIGAQRVDVPAIDDRPGFTAITLGPVTFCAGEVLP